MTRISEYADYNNDQFDEWSDDAKERDEYDKVTRCGLDDPMAMRNVDLSTRLDLLFVTMLAYDINYKDYISFLHLMYPDKEQVKNGEAIKKLKEIRTKYKGASK
jgi:hypothetical protein